MIALVDYGMGNLRSVQKALEFLGAEVRITSDPVEVRSAEAVVLPGVGAFGSAMERLQSAGLASALRQAIEQGKPFLGICLGLQLLFDTSDESPNVQGLGLLRGRVVGFRSRPDFTLPVPHIGWNAIHFTQPEALLWRGLGEGSYVYFVHSYYPEPADPALISATSHYGVEFTVAVSAENLHAVQFHPEKSGQVGLKILRNFLSALV